MINASPRYTLPYLATTLLLLLLLLSGCGSLSDEGDAPLPTRVHISDATPEFQETAPQITELQPIAIPVAFIANIVPAVEPIPNQVVITFAENATEAERLAYIDTIGGTVGQELAGLNAVVVNVPKDTMVDNLPQSPIVVVSEPDYLVSAMQASTNDPLYADQWALPMMNVPVAWAELPTETFSLIIAVIDSGICMTHPDLEGRIFPGVDYVEDDDLPQDELGHGCGVSGIIAANSNNGMGIAGIAPNAHIMPLRVLDANGIGAYSDVAAAIVYATDNGASIINLSLGGVNASQTLQNAVNYAASRGVLLIAAAGNTGDALPLYPARYTEVIAVGSVEMDGQPSFFSNQGVDLWAPGSNILTTRINGGYAVMTGTSFAAPQVAGVAALEIARGKTLLVNGGIVSAQSDTAVVVDTPVEDLPPRETLLLQSEEIAPPTPTNEWGVILVDGTDPDALAAKLGFENLGQIAHLEDTYLFRRAGTETSIQAAADAAQVLEVSPQVTFYEQQVLRQHVLREPTDPLYADEWQWFLNNTNAFVGSVLGQDANVIPAWNAGYDGTAVTIAIVDDGLQRTHPDLVPNYYAGGSYDFNDNDFDPSPSSVDKHGTSVGGVAAAADDGATCGVGAAYNARLAGIRLTASGVTDATEATALTYAYQNNDIYNNSWGPSDNGTIFSGPDSFLKAALADGITNGRGGLGNIYIWAGGNGWGSLDNSNADGYANNRYVIGVGASSWDGRHSYYSDIGSNLLVNAPSNGASSGGGGIATTDLMGGDGYNNSQGWSNYCTDGFGGTSSAAPLVAGVTALILDANPNLTWRDVQHILVSSASKNDPEDSSWDTNAAGHDYSLKYGMGRVDAGAAVTLAETWANVAPEVSYNSSTIAVNEGIPDGSGDWDAWYTAWQTYSPLPEAVPGTPTTDMVVVSDGIKIEHVEVTLSVSHVWRGDIIVELESPSGTVSQLFSSRPLDNNDNISWTFSSVHFWDELSVGTWTIRVYDGWSITTGTFNSWQLKIYGTLSCSSVTDIPSAECGALQDFYGDTNGENWTNNAGWFTTPTACNWYGITCDGGNHIIELEMPSNNLNGSLPDLAALSSLQILDLGSNHLAGNLPPLTSLTGLTDVGLGDNQFTGSIPSLTGLTSLENLDLGGNQLTGSIPSLTGLTALQSLFLDDNQLSGNIPSLASLGNVYFLFLNDNQLDGAIPDLSALANVLYLSLNNNELDGAIPNLAALTLLSELNLSNNHLDGGIPDIASLDALTYLALQNNQLTGTIPDMFVAASLQWLYVQNNTLAGDVLVAVPDLVDLDVGYNRLTATDSGVVASLNTEDPDWAMTQTIPVSNLIITNLTPSSLDLTWTPIPYTGDGGYYEIDYATDLGGPWTTVNTTDKTASSQTLPFNTDVLYYFRMRTFTPAHGSQQNDLLSAETDIVSIDVDWVVITEQEFHDAMETLIEEGGSLGDINFVLSDFTTDAMLMTVRTADGIVGQVTVSLIRGEGFIDFTVDGVTVLGSYETSIYEELPALLIQTLDVLLDRKIGIDHDIATMFITSSTIHVALTP